jgi:hypothetical protein
VIGKPWMAHFKGDNYHTNDFGYIVDSGTYNGEDFNTFLMIPVPLLLLGPGLLGLWDGGGLGKVTQQFSLGKYPRQGQPRPCLDY